MSQFGLFSVHAAGGRLPTVIERIGDKLVIPEGVQTIPATHGLHRFPGKFIPNLPRYIIRETLASDTSRIIYDPFCGSGTTLVEACLEGRRFIGTDIDALSVMMSQAKTTPLTDADIDSIQRVWAAHDFMLNAPELVPAIPNFSHWFSPLAIQQLSGIKRRCLGLPEHQRLFSLSVFSSIIRRVSKADDQTQKTYVSGTLKKDPPAPVDLFPTFLERAIAGMLEFRDLLPANPIGSVLQADARTFQSRQVVNDVVTSPPYIDSIDYMYNQMLEYFWLLSELGLDGHAAFRLARKSPMGFRRERDQSTDLIEALGPHGSEFVEGERQIGKESPKEALAVRNFFIDYLAHLRNVRRFQAPGGRYVTVVGNSFVRGATVPTAEYLVALHRAAGHSLIDRFSYEIRRHYMKFPRRANSGTIKLDHVLVFDT